MQTYDAWEEFCHAYKHVKKLSWGKNLQFSLKICLNSNIFNILKAIIISVVSFSSIYQQIFLMKLGITVYYFKMLGVKT